MGFCLACQEELKSGLENGSISQENLIKILKNTDWNSYCRNVKKLLCVGIHWRAPFIEDLLETVQVVW